MKVSVFQGTEDSGGLVGSCVESVSSVLGHRRPSHIAARLMVGRLMVGRLMVGRSAEGPVSMRPLRNECPPQRMPSETNALRNECEP
jgi:hypothetical protein